MSSSSSDTTTTTTTKILSNVNTPNKHNPLAHHQGDLIIINRASFGGGHCSNSAFLTMHHPQHQSANKKGIRTRSTKTNNITMSKQTTFFCNGTGGHIRAMIITVVVLAVTILPRPLGVDCQLQAPSSSPVDSSDYSGNDSVRLFLEAYEPWLN